MSRSALEALTQAVHSDAAIRRVRRLQPVGGIGDKIFPPTYPGARKSDPARHVFEHRHVLLGDSKTPTNVLCVLIDSVQSQANRLEEALKVARDQKQLAFPAIAVDFEKTAVPDIGRITTLDAPHRVFDAIIRDSELGGRRFKETAEGQRLIAAKSHNAQAVLELSPTALIFGAWNSTGEGGGLGAKFPRVVVSEIIGVNVATEHDVRTGEDRPSGQRTGSRVDPLGIRSAAKVYKMPNGDWSIEPPKDKKGEKERAKEVRPSEINHSNIAPTVTPLGVSVDHALHTFVLSLAALRRLRFGKPDADHHARTALAALALAACTAQDRNGYALRSRCDLVAEEGSSESFAIVRSNGTVEPLRLSFEEACKLVEAATARLSEHKLHWRKEDLVLQPQSKLIELVKLSREKALEGVEEPAGGE